MTGFKNRVLKVQNELKAPKNQTNNFGKYKYRSCEDILEAAKPLCANNNLILTLSDEIANIGERFYVKSTATLTSADSEECISAVAYAREPEVKKGMDDSQITGTASSYARKYALNGLLCIDDSKDADTDEYKKQQDNTQPKRQNPPQHQLVICPVCGKEVHNVTNNGVDTPAAVVLEKLGMCYKCHKAKASQPNGGGNGQK